MQFEAGKVLEKVYERGYHPRRLPNDKLDGIMLCDLLNLIQMNNNTD